MKKYLFVFLFLFAFLAKINAQIGWINVLNQSNTLLEKSFFINENTGFVVGALDAGNYWAILKTTNGGSNWTQQNGSFGSPILNSVFFVGNSNGYIVGGDNTSPPVYFKTTNQGVNWISVDLGYPDYCFYDIAFMNSNVGIISGSAIILRTSNGGNNWYQINGNTNVFLYSVAFAKSGSGLCYAVGGKSCILRSLDAGQSWSILNLGTSNDTVYKSISIVNDLVCYIAGYISNYPYNSVLLKTIDGGNNWQNITINLPGSLYFSSVIYFFSDTSGLLAGSGIFKTTNGGGNWKNQEAPAVGISYSHIFFLNQNFGVALAYFESIYNGLIYKTTTGGNGPPPAPSNLYCTRKYGVNRLSWLDNSLSEIGFKIQRSNISDTVWTVIDSVYTNIISYNDSNENSNVKYRIYAFNEFGNSSFSNTAIPVILNIDKQLKMGINFLENYPNPFNSFTVISFQLPVSGKVSLKVYDMLGRAVETLLNERLQPGIYSVDWNATHYPSGVYFYRLTADSFSETKRMALVK